MGTTPNTRKLRRGIHSDEPQTRPVRPDTAPYFSTSRHRSECLFRRRSGNCPRHQRQRVDIRRLHGGYHRPLVRSSATAHSSRLEVVRQIVPVPSDPVEGRPVGTSPPPPPTRRGTRLSSPKPSRWSSQRSRHLRPGELTTHSLFAPISPERNRPRLLSVERNRPIVPLSARWSGVSAVRTPALTAGDRRGARQSDPFDLFSSTSTVRFRLGL